MFNIAINTFKEIIRNKYMYIILFFAFIFILFSVALTKISIGDSTKIIIDFGLAMIEIFGLIGVLFIGSQLLFKEIEGKTLFLILSKPIKRSQFILGKFLGFTLVIALILIFQSLIFIGLLLYQNIDIQNLILWSLVNTFFKLEILLAIVFFLSSFMGNLLTIIVSLMIYFVGHSFPTVLDIAYKTKNEVFIYGAKAIGILFPPLSAMNTKDLVGIFDNFSISYFLINIGYALLYITILLIFSIIIFNKKKFEN